MTDTKEAPAPALDDLQEEIRATLAGYLSYEPASEATDEVVEAIGLEALLTRLADAEAGLPARCPTTPDLFASDTARLSAEVAAMKEALRFYGDEANWRPSTDWLVNGDDQFSLAERDAGSLARTALKEAGSDE